MKYPQIVILGLDEWLARQLRPLAEEHRWKLHDLRQTAAANVLLTSGRPTVLVVQIDPAVDAPPGLMLLVNAYRIDPDIAIVVVSDGKMPDDDRGHWTASLMDLGAAFVLFPPLTGPVLEDLVGGLMAATCARLRPSATTTTSESVIDLAEEGAHAE